MITIIRILCITMTSSLFVFTLLFHSSFAENYSSIDLIPPSIAGGLALSATIWMLCMFALDTYEQLKGRD